VVASVAFVARAFGRTEERAMNRLRALAFSALLTLALAASAFGQFIPPAPNRSLLPPFDYPPTLTTTPQQVLPIDTARRRIIFFNPSATATIAFCPSGVTRAGVTFTCAVNGAGSITLLPLGSFVLDGGTEQGPPLSMGAAWMGVSTGSAPATLFEFE